MKPNWHTIAQRAPEFAVRAQRLLREAAQLAYDLRQAFKGERVCSDSGDQASSEAAKDCHDACKDTCRS